MLNEAKKIAEEIDTEICFPVRRLFRPQKIDCVLSRKSNTFLDDFGIWLGEAPAKASKHGTPGI